MGHLNHCRFFPAKTHMIQFDDKFHRVPEGRVSLHIDRLSRKKTHFHEPHPEGADAADARDNCGIALSKILECHCRVTFIGYTYEHTTHVAKMNRLRSVAGSSTRNGER